FDARDLQSLGTGEAIVRVERADHDFTICVRATAVPGTAEAAERREAIRARSRSRWGTPREEIDRVLAAAYGEIAVARPEKQETRDREVEVAAEREAPAVVVVPQPVDRAPVLKPAEEQPPRASKRTVAR